MQTGLLSDFGRAGIGTESLIPGCTVRGAVTVKGLSARGPWIVDDRPGDPSYLQ